MDKPLTMAAPSRDGDDDRDRDTPNGVMAPSAKTSSRTEFDEESSPSSEDTAQVSSQDEPASAASPPEGMAASAAGSVDGGPAAEDTRSPAPNGSKPSIAKPAVPMPADVISMSDGRSKDGSGQNGERLPTVISARQAVRQAVAATNNWFTGRAAKVAGDQSAVASPTSAAAAAVSPDATMPSATSAPLAPPAAPGTALPAPGATARTPQPQYRPPGNKSFTATTRRPKAPRRAPRQTQLVVARVEPWSVMKFSAVVSVAAFIVIFVAVAVLYAVLSGLGVFDSLQHFVNTVTSSKNNSGTNIRGWFSAARILGYTGMLGSLNIVLITAMATIGAVIYNLISRAIGGIEISLRETD